MIELPARPTPHRLCARLDLRAVRSLLLGVLAMTIASTSLAMASEFDKCVLQNMRGVTSDLAAASVKESCLRTVEMQLPKEALQTFQTATARFGQLPSYVGGVGLYITVNNNSGYTITEITMAIENKKTRTDVSYVIRDFPFVPPPGVIAMGPPRDPTLLKMIGPGYREFYTPINETRNPNEWGNFFSWTLISAKGFRD